MKIIHFMIRVYKNTKIVLLFKFHRFQMSLLPLSEKLLFYLCPENGQRCFMIFSDCCFKTTNLAFQNDVRLKSI